MYIFGVALGLAIVLAVLIKLTKKDKKKDYYNLESDILTNKYLWSVFLSFVNSVGYYLLEYASNNEYHLFK